MIIENCVGTLEGKRGWCFGRVLGDWVEPFNYFAERLSMGTCFVMQPFDNGEYDKRYDDVIAPAIDDCDLEPYRVDRDPSVSIPIEEIETGIIAC